MPNPGRNELYRLLNTENLTIAEIARRHGVSRQRVSQWLRAESFPPRILQSNELEQAQKRAEKTGRLVLTNERISAMRMLVDVWIYAGIQPDVAQIVTSGPYVVIDNCFWDMLTCYRWFVQETLSGCYVHAVAYDMNGERYRLKLHELLMPGSIHVNGDGLDNRIANLKKVTNCS